MRFNAQKARPRNWPRFFVGCFCFLFVVFLFFFPFWLLESGYSQNFKILYNKTMKRILSIETKEHIGESVKVCGWVHSIRSHGKVVFFDLRDSSGILQIVFTPSLKQDYDLALSARPEWVLEICGKIGKRPGNMVNPKILTGEIELQAESLKVISKAKTLPFEIDKDTLKVKEETRLKYRYLDLRSERMKNILCLRNKAILFIRNYLN